MDLGLLRRAVVVIVIVGAAVALLQVFAQLGPVGLLAAHHAAHLAVELDAPVEERKVEAAAAATEDEGVARLG